MGPSNATAAYQPSWPDAVRQIKIIFDTPGFRAVKPLELFAAGARATDAIASNRAAHSPADVAWDVSEWLTQHLAPRNLRGLVQASRQELANGLACEVYDLGPDDMFLTFMVFYLTTPFGSKARQVAPQFFLVFEVWLAYVDRDLLDRLHAVRRILLSHDPAT